VEAVKWGTFVDNNAPVKLDYAPRPPKPTAIRLCMAAILGAFVGAGVGLILCELTWGFATASHRITVPLVDTVRKIDIAVWVVVIPCGVVFGLWRVRRESSKNQ
jgi:hypothetical protein